MREGDAAIRLFREVLGLRISRFAVIGVVATVIYALMALLLADIQGLAAAPASVIAFAPAALFSYSGHKYVTFGSAGAHRFELPRFLTVSLAGLAIATFLPALLSDWLGLPAVVPVLLVCVTIPAVNYIILDRWVFRDA